MHLSALEQKHEKKNKKRTVLRFFTPAEVGEVGEFGWCPH